MKNEQSVRQKKWGQALGGALVLAVSSCMNLPPTRSPIEEYRGPRAKSTPLVDQEFLNSEHVNVSLQNVIFEKVSPSRGRWSGTLTGEGAVQLRLMFYSKGRLASSIYMGSTNVIGKEVPFVFETKSPRGIWSWKIALTASKQKLGTNNT